MLRVKMIPSRRIALLLCGILASQLAMEGREATAQDPIGFELYVSPYPRVLDAFHDKLDGRITAQQFMDIQMEESCDNPHLRVRARNKPTFMLTNELTSVEPLTSFSLSIEDGPYIFGNGDLPSDSFTNFVKLLPMYTDAGVSITGSSLSQDAKTLTVNFSGLQAGKSVLFCLDLDATGNNFPYPDYRNALFGAPLDAGASGTDPASYVASFGVSPNPRTVTGELQEISDVPAYSNANIRPYRNMDTVEVIGDGGRVPEPSSAMLALAAVGGLAAMRRRGRASAC